LDTLLVLGRDFKDWIVSVSDEAGDGVIERGGVCDSSGESLMLISFPSDEVGDDGIEQGGVCASSGEFPMLILTSFSCRLCVEMRETGMHNSECAVDGSRSAIVIIGVKELRVFCPVVSSAIEA